jgi:Na+-translocating ferredoxin:NAD+ oxidoreductase subunit B
MDNLETYRALAKHLDSFPQGLPASKNGKEFALLAHLFTAQEAQLAVHLSQTHKSIPSIAMSAGVSNAVCQDMIRKMVNKGLVNLRYGPSGTEASLQPFILGIFASQVFRMDRVFARLFEDYYLEAGQSLLSMKPQFHRIVPVNSPMNFDVEILPEEDVTHLLSSKQAWAVIECVCRKQQALSSVACGHPIRVCLAMSDIPGIFDHMTETVDVLNLESALEVLDMSARAGLVHSVSNWKNDISYICSCCTCGCFMMRGMAQSEICNAFARSSYYAVVDDELCTAQGECQAICQFHAIIVKRRAVINTIACTGCGACVRICPEGAIRLLPRPKDDIKPMPENQEAWLDQRRQARRLK